jgi:adenylate cyclase
VIGRAWMNNWCEDRDASMRAILNEVQIALTLDENEAEVHRILGTLKLNFEEYDKAIYHQERALSLNPNSDIIVVQQGELLTWLGRPVEGIEWIHHAMRLNPYHHSVTGTILAAPNTPRASMPMRFNRSAD